MASLHIAPRLAQVLIDRGSQHSASAHAKYWEIRIGKFLVPGFIDEEHQAMGVHLKHFARIGASDVQNVARFVPCGPRPLGFLAAWRAFAVSS